VRNVSNSIAHDLRTPLAELRSRLEELVLTRPDPAHVLHEVEGAIDDVDRVIDIFNALLRLAEIDTGARRSGFIEIDAALIAAEVTDFYQPLAESQNRRLKFSSSGKLSMQGDPLLLAQAIGNLVDNALKFSPMHGMVSIDASRAANGVPQISVADNGPGIPDTEKEKVLDRFYRGDTSRGTPGVGLGLSLVAAVAKLHGGTLLLSDQNPGLKVTLRCGD
jgi:signal transduction histidine kinase